MESRPQSGQRRRVRLRLAVSDVPLGEGVETDILAGL